MRKSILKRIKITKTGKMLYRHAGHNHFNAKASRLIQRRQKKMQEFQKTIEKKVKAYL